MLILNFLLFLVACFFFAVSGHTVVKSIIKIQGYYHLREFIVGLAIIGISTSLPELSVGVISALNNISSLSLGNIIGANVIDLTLVIGLVAIVGKKVNFEVEIQKRSIFLIALMVMLPLFLFLDHELSRLDGVILLIAFLFYMANLLSKRKRFKIAKKEKINKKGIYKYIGLFVVSLIALILFARLIVYAASEIALEMGFPPILIGVLIVSIGTTLPEIFFETDSVLKGHSSIAVGDLLGSLAFNSTLILGIVALISPVHAHFSTFLVGAAFLVISLITFIIFVKTERTVTRKEGIFLIFLYLLFLITSIIVG